eukprot:CAMPEP_0201521734 /NCGR_PEP_ID=MMETSP0161_2-20130828/15875_1 /ASSEMBLY_ACC=CAM_ASM_000251 /TAXON_ID=180227 /ORGANISM="Neoparamoeba aestuarina, Strain SoJaBio B1-5/56/2" /LENGTH=77 /DNA_ID=CAMNT_0047920423 /DNA_START=17 /DNA_END=250 /DNA_ORIENTATION=+
MSNIPAPLAAGIPPPMTRGPQSSSSARALTPNAGPSTARSPASGEVYFSCTAEEVRAMMVDLDKVYTDLYAAAKNMG